MTDEESAGARWLREDKARRAGEAADAERARRQKALAIVARARAAQALEQQAALGGGASAADDERALMERVLAASTPQLRERLESELKALRARMSRGTDRRRD